MRTELKISIPEPCQENWKNMSANQKGRHCKSCEKTVVDFTPKTDEFIVNYFLENNNVCGRFKKQQLNRPIVFSRKSKNNYWSYLASGLLAFLSLSPQESKAQVASNPDQTNITNTHLVKGKIAQSILRNKTISGLIIDESGLPLPAATVLVKGTNNGTSTDFDGNYKLKVKKGDILVISYVGYLTIEIIIDNSNIYNVTLDVGNSFDQQVVVAGGISVRYCINDKEQTLSPEELKKKKELNSLAKRNRKVIYNQKKRSTKN